MTTCYMAGDPLQSTFFVPGGAVPANGAQLFTYLAGSSTKTTVYKDSAGNTAWSNPIVLDSGGNLPSGGVIWIPTGVTIKVIYAPSNDTDPPASPYRTIDNITGINDVSAQTGAEWLTGATPTYVSATSFTVAGDQTATYTKGRRIKATVTAGTVYATITNAVYGALTTVTVSGGALDSGLSVLSYGLFDPANTSISFYETSRQATASIAASATTNIWGTDGDSVHITGTTAIGSFSTAPYVGATKRVIFDSQVQLNYNASTLPLSSTSGAYTLAGETIEIYADTVSKMLPVGFQAKAKVSTFNFSASTAPSSVPITGVGFKPSAICFLASTNGTSTMSFGVDDGSFHFGVGDDGADVSGTYFLRNTESILYAQAAGATCLGHIASFDNDGFTVSFSKTGAPVGVIVVGYLAIRL